MRLRRFLCGSLLLILFVRCTAGQSPYGTISGIVIDPSGATIIGAAPVRVGIEAAIRQGWDPIIGSDGAFIGMSGFGASAPAKELFRHFGITAERCAEAAMAELTKSSHR